MALWVVQRTAVSSGTHTHTYTDAHTHTHGDFFSKWWPWFRDRDLAFAIWAPASAHTRIFNAHSRQWELIACFRYYRTHHSHPTPPPHRPRPFLWAKPNNGDKQLKSVRFVLGHRISTLGNLFAHWKGLSSPVGGGCLWPPKPPTTPSLQNPSAPPCLAQWPAVRQFAGENRNLYRF